MTAKVTLIIVGLVAIGLVVAAVAQVPPITIGGGTPGTGAAGAVNVNAIVVLSQTGTTRYVAAGTSQGIRVYEVRRVGREYQVTDVTKE
jgi:hypothetical protein